MSGFYAPRPTLAELYTDDNSIFSGMTIPAALDLSTLTGIIVQELGPLDTLFGSSAAIKAYLPVWSAAKISAWNKMYTALSADYNPIHNYDRTDTETEETTGTAASTFAGTTQASGSDTLVRSRQGFNSSDYVPSDKDTTTLGAGNESTSSTTASNTGGRERTLNSSGNIGVTTSQQMIEAEIGLRNTWTMYGIICEAFKRDLCVGVW